MSERIEDKDEPVKAVLSVFVDAEGNVNYTSEADPWVTIDLANIVAKSENDKIINATRILLSSFMQDLKREETK